MNISGFEAQYAHQVIVWPDWASEPLVHVGSMYYAVFGSLAYALVLFVTILALRHYVIHR